MSANLNTLLAQADALRFKLLAIVGRNDQKKNDIIQALELDGWTFIDVENELIDLHEQLKSNDDQDDVEIATKIKEWFLAKPNKLILANASILYHDLFLKISPVGAFKYNSRNKNCVLFLEDENKLGQRLYYGQMGKEDYYDREISDIVLIDIQEILDTYTRKDQTINRIAEPDQLDQDAIGHLFTYHQIKDVVDIDADLKEIKAQRELVGSFIISDSLERQILEFFEDIEKPTHKARNIIGNYGSGKSHLVGFLTSLVEKPELAEAVSNEHVKSQVRQHEHPFLTVQFELQSGQVELKRWFYAKTRQQLKAKHDLDIPAFDPIQDFDDKENIAAIIEIVKHQFPSHGLLIVIDEISDFLSAKQKEGMKSDLQFLRVLGQVCQDQDFMFIGSMQEDVFTSPKFKDVASEIGRIGERFQNIIIHKEDIKKVISERIVPKSTSQKHQLEKRLSPFAEKIEAVGKNIDEYINMFPLTPFLIELFSDLPYFEKRGVIQFAMSEIRYILNQPFPYFITFDKIYDLLENNPNKRNLEEIYELSKSMSILLQKINLLEDKYQKDAEKIVKGLAIYSLWNKREKGATSQELANNLMLLPQRKLFSSADNISLIIKKIREVTEGQYIKTHKDQSTGLEYFSFDAATGPDPEEKIIQKAAAVSDDELEHEIFAQLREILEVEPFEGRSDVFKDECEWRSVKSFRRGLILFAQKGYRFQDLPLLDYAIIFVSPFADSFTERVAKNQLTIKLHISDPQNVELLKEIVAIKSLIAKNFQKTIMVRKLDGRINGAQQASPPITGFKYRLAKLITHFSECQLNGVSHSIKTVLGRERGSVLEIIEELKTALFDNEFNKSYPLHPSYSIQLSSRNIITSLNSIVSELVQGNFTNLGRTGSLFLDSLDLLDNQKFPDLSQSKIAQNTLDIIKSKNEQVTDIEKDVVIPLHDSDYGLEPPIVHFYLALTTILGKTYLQLKGGERIDINNIKEKLKSLASFETIAYVRMHESGSYENAVKMLNALGLNGSQMNIEKQRFTAFREYKEKIHSIRQNINDVSASIEILQQKPQIYIDLDAVSITFTGINEIDWPTLDINNHMQFAAIKNASNLSNKIVLRLKDLNELTDALDDYSTIIHDGILYMNDAIDMLEKNSILVTDAQKKKSLIDIRAEVLLICSDFSTFFDRSQRNPVKGKIQQFKKIYIFDLYIPTHAKYVGPKLNWSILNTYPNLDEFKKISLLSKLTCINDAEFNQRVISWNDVKTYRCTHSDLEHSLSSVVRCQKCLFPSRQNYQRIPQVLDSIQDDIVTWLEIYQEQALKEIRAYRDNVQYLNAGEKQLINAILENQELPRVFTAQTVQTINKLFKEIDIVEIDDHEILTALFPDNQMTTVEELRKRFFTLEKQLVQNKQESEIRIKLKYKSKPNE
jgi:hypothetical protein